MLRSNLFILCAGLALAHPIRAQVTANPESGTADYGTPSKPIKNVASNDFVNGAAATLGPSGNATVALSGKLQKGIALNTTSGAITTTSTTAVGTYAVQYTLCDAANPTNCSSTTDTVTVQTPPVLVANPDSGSAIAGAATKAVPDVAANDTVNGAPAMLGAGGNATVAQGTSPTWPAGIKLTPSTGAVTTSAAQPPGVYPLSYTLCDQNNPAVNCTTGTVTVTISVAVTVLPMAGSAVAGAPGTPIGNVAIPDTVNNVPVTFGVSGNATVTQGPNWPTGFSLDPNSGAINSDPNVAVGTYTLPFTLCDLSGDCSDGTATVAITAAFREQQATSVAMGDVEFDWGRDGVPCPTCNFGDGNDRANWTDRDGNIWIAHLNIATGQFVSPQANDELADTSAYFWNTWGNGPEWAFSTQNGQVVSQLVYSRWQPGQPAHPQPGAGYAGAAYATQTGYNDYNNGVGTNWTARFLPGAVNSGDGQRGTNNSNLPEASQCNTDPVAEVVYKNFASPLQLFLENVSSAAGNERALLPFPSRVESNGIGERFVPCTHQLLYQASAPYGSTGETVQQVFWYDWDTGVTEQLTTDPVNKYSGFMFRAPDFLDNYIFYTVANHNAIEVFEVVQNNADGSPVVQLVNKIYSPLPDQQYLNTSEPFINCTPVCTTYAFVTISTGASQKGIEQPNGLAVVALSPATPLFYILVSADDPATRQRLDPEYFITPQGPYLYYNRIVPLQLGRSRYQNQGEWFIDMQLGAPSGPCVGSSAEGGLANGC
jgi:hypothetical protein